MLFGTQTSPGTHEPTYKKSETSPTFAEIWNLSYATSPGIVDV